MFTDLMARLGHVFTNADLLRQALTHRSYHFENKLKSLGHFERLEFLGDAVLDMVLSELLMTRFDVGEGVLSKWRASLVNEATLGDVARGLGLGEHLYLGRSEEPRRAELRPRLLASAYEAVLAAIYLDCGLAAVKSAVAGHFEARLGALTVDAGFHADYKTRLQEWVQRRHKTTPVYRLRAAEGPEHDKQFEYEVSVGDQVLGTGRGPTRKGAEQAAAGSALSTIEGVPQ